MKIVDSLAGTGRKYVKFQATMRDNVLHVQVPGPHFNRAYGIASDNNLSGVVSQKTINALRNLGGVESLATTKTSYFNLQAKPLDHGGVHFQIPCPRQSGGEGRMYGCAFNVKDSELSTYLRSILDGQQEEKKAATAPLAVQEKIEEAKPTASKTKDLGIHDQFKAAVFKFITNHTDLDDVVFDVAETFDITPEEAEQIIAEYLQS